MLLRSHFRETCSCDGIPRKRSHPLQWHSYQKQLALQPEINYCEQITDVALTGQRS